MLEDGKIIIDIFREKKPDEFTAALADKESRTETGSASALTAAQAAALAKRAAAYVTAEQPENERAAYLFRNLEILRTYMIKLIDEDVKCRAPLRKAFKIGDEKAIDACRHTACAINEEIIGMMTQLIDFNAELSALVPAEVMHYAAESTALAQAAMSISRMYILNMASYSSDETYRFVTRRENELTFEASDKTAAAVYDKFENIIK